MDTLYLEKLFEDFISTESSYTQSLMNSTLNETIQSVWSIERQIMYRNGVVIGKYRESDEKTLAIIKSEISNDEIQHILKNYYSSEIKMLIKMNDNYSDPIRNDQLVHNRTALEDLEQLDLSEWVNKHQSWLRYALPDIQSDIVIKFIWLYYAFEMYKRNGNGRFDSSQDNIEKLYANQFDKTSQFHKYGLIPINEDIEMICIEPPRIYDKLNNKTIMIKDIPLCFAYKMNELMTNNVIGDFAVRVCNNSIFDGKNELEVLLEELERGRIFSLANLEKLDVTKLYSKNYDDSLWIVIDSSNITFEELREDFTVYEEQIVTQVVHLQYKKLDSQFYITHLDHEYIFYSFEEFDNRRLNYNQKGSSSPRMKTFKLDNAKIPFELSYEVVWKESDGNRCSHATIPFIYFVLDCYFQHKDLLKEYFQEIVRI